MAQLYPTVLYVADSSEKEKKTKKHLHWENVINNLVYGLGMER